MFFTRVGPEGWARLPLAAQCALPLKDRRVVGWLIVTGRLRPSADYLVACRPYLGEVAARHHRAFHDRFAATSEAHTSRARATTTASSASIGVRNWETVFPSAKPPVTTVASSQAWAITSTAVATPTATDSIRNSRVARPYRSSLGSTALTPPWWPRWVGV